MTTVFAKPVPIADPLGAAVVPPSVAHHIIAGSLAPPFQVFGAASKYLHAVVHMDPDALV